MRRRPFGFDTLFAAACVLYAANRLLVPLGTPFFRTHFADCLLIPAALPPMLWVQHRLGLREHTLPPQGRELMLHLAVWSVAAELLAPQLGPVTADLLDVLAYAAGTAVGWWWWKGGAHRVRPCAADADANRTRG